MTESSISLMLASLEPIPRAKSSSYDNMIETIQPLPPVSETETFWSTNVRDINHHQGLMTEFQSFLLSQKFIDVSIIGSDALHSVKCHQFVLSFASPLLSELLLSSKGEESVLIIIPDLNTTQIAEIVEAIYYEVDNIKDVLVLEWLLHLGIIRSSTNKTDDFHLMSDNCDKEREKEENNLNDIDSAKDSMKKNNNNNKNKKNNNNNKSDTNIDDKYIDEQTITCLESNKEKSSSSYSSSLNEEEYYTEAATKSRSHECSECHKKFLSSSSLHQHSQLHKPGNFHCSQCSKTFRTQRYLLQHNKKHRGSNYIICCPICSKVLAGRHELKCHIRLHTGEKPFKCHLCSATFRNRSTKNNHVKTHLGDKKAICQICNHSFVQIGDLKKHMRSHTGEKPYSCSMCGRNFARSDYLAKHCNVHKREDYHFKSEVDEEVNAFIHEAILTSGNNEDLMETDLDLMAEPL